jgi:general secretion pathway protein G
MNRARNFRNGRRGLTLIEMVIVVLVIGILAAVAAPKMFNTAGQARENGTRQSLMVIRNAIELCRASTGALPGATDGAEATFKNDLRPYLQGGFPTAQIGNVGATVRMTNAGTPLAATGTQSWAYDYSTGEFIVNHANGSAW